MSTSIPPEKHESTLSNDTTTATTTTPLLPPPTSDSTLTPSHHLELLDKKRSRLAWAGAVTAGAVVLLTGGIATAFIGWILIRRFPVTDLFKPGLLVNLPSMSFVVSEGEKFENDGSSETTASLRALTISALAVSGVPPPLDIAISAGGLE